MRRRQLGALMVLAMIAIGATLWIVRAGSGQGPSAEAPRALPAPDDRSPVAVNALASGADHSVGSTSTSIRAARPLPAAPVIDTTALPSIDAPLVQSWDALKAAADAGSPRAACRLGSGLRRCRMHQEMVRSGWAKGLVEHAQGEPQSPTLPLAQQEREIQQQIDMVRRIADEAERNGVFCRGIDPLKLSQAGRWTYLAASRGSLSATNDFLMLTQFEPDLLSQLDLLQRYRDEGPALFEKSLTSGDRGLLSTALKAYLSPTQGGVFLTQIIAPDPVHASAVRQVLIAEYTKVMRTDVTPEMKARFLDSHAPPLSDGEKALSLADQARADAMAGQLLDTRQRNRDALARSLAARGLDQRSLLEDPCLR